MILFASDYDGTLFHWDGVHVSPGDLEAIRSFREAGHSFGVCTGRSYQGILRSVPDGLSFDFYILASGALILDRNGTPIRKAEISAGTGKEIYDRYDGQFPIVIHAKDTVFNFGEPFPLQTKVESWEEIGDRIYGLSFGTSSPEHAANVAGEINRDFGDAVSASPNKSFVDICPKGCSKGEALRYLKTYESAEETAGIGDSYNDIPLLDAADHSFTFRASPEAVQSHADTLVDTVEEAVLTLLNA